MQNDMLMTIHTSKSKPEIEFQYGCHPFSETGSSFIWALDWAVANIEYRKHLGGGRCCVEKHSMKQLNRKMAPKDTKNFYTKFLWWPSRLCVQCALRVFSVEPCLFTRSYAQSNRCTDFHALWLKRRVSANGWFFWGLEGEKYVPKSPQK